MNYLAKLLRKMCGGDSGRAVLNARAGEAPDSIAASAREAAALVAAGNEALAQKATAQALELFGSALHLQHDNADAHRGMGLAHLRRNELEDAADSLQMALHFRPDLAEAHNLLGACALREGRLEAAVQSLQAAVDLQPGCAIYQSDLGYVLMRDCGEFDRGIAHLKTALQLDRHSSTIWCNYCVVLWHEGKLDEIISVCHRLLEANPADHEARLNRALALLKLGRFAEAWPDYEARKETRSNFLPRPYAAPQWTGESLQGKTVLICAEQGIGDEIMFASCIPEIVKSAGKCIIECTPRLQALFQRSFPGSTVRGILQSERSQAWFERLGHVDYLVDAGSLPGFFRRSETSFANGAAYLRADPAGSARCAARLQALGSGLKVGIAWRGGAVSTRRALRSMALLDLAPVFAVPGIRFVSLQHDASEREIGEASAQCGVDIPHWPEILRDFDESAALVASLDLVITVCTATVHLAGALGRPAWVMVPAVAEWRYMAQGETMPWYSSVRMVRQQESGRWEPVIAAIAADLARKSGSR